MSGSPPRRRRAAGGRGGGVRSVARSLSRGGGKAGGAGVDGRIRLLRLVFVGVLLLAGGRAIALASSSDNLTRLAEKQQTAEVDLPAHRGAILDRNGEKLAVGLPAETVCATPYLLDDASAAARKLCAALKIKKRAARKSVEEALSDGDSSFAYVARNVDPKLAAAAVDLDIPGVYSYSEEDRSYPLKGSAAQVIGCTNTDNDGIAGIELEYDDELSGKAGSEVVVRDASGETIKTVQQTQPVDGKDVRLTIDEEIQLTAEDVLAKTVKSSYAKAATAIVMDPRSGEILAMANVPKVEDNKFGVTPAYERNRAVTDSYEPGSIFKLVTISGALADGTVTTKSRFTLAPTITVCDRTIHEAESRGTVNYSVRDILVHSSNVGAVKIGILMHKSGLAKWVKAFGFGKTTGVDFPGEVQGIVLPVDQWSGSSIGNIPMGQGISVTPMQMAVAFSTVANDGVRVQPRLVAQVGTRVYDSGATKRVIPTKVARTVRKMLADAVAEGTGTKAQIEGYEVAGKTGTAQKVASDGTYSESAYVASFVGMVPADHPRLVVLVSVDEPTTSIYGGDIAAPAVQKIMRFALQRLEIAP